MSDLRTFSDFKNWLLVGAAGVIFVLLGLIANDNRRRIEVAEARIEERGPKIESLISRVAAIESRQDVQQGEVFRRLERIEAKLDKLK